MFTARWREESPAASPAAGVACDVVGASLDSPGGVVAGGGEGSPRVWAPPLSSVTVEPSVCVVSPGGGEVPSPAAGWVVSVGVVEVAGGAAVAVVVVGGATAASAPAAVASVSGFAAPSGAAT